MRQNLSYFTPLQHHDTANNTHTHAHTAAIAGQQPPVHDVRRETEDEEDQSGAITGSHCVTLQLHGTALCKFSIPPPFSPHQ